jgi:hypothetical protein
MLEADHEVVRIAHHITVACGMMLAPVLHP